MSVNAEKKKKAQREAVVHHVSLLTDDDLYLFNEGSHFRLYEKLGARPLEKEDMEGTHFCSARWRAYTRRGRWSSR